MHLSEINLLRHTLSLAQKAPNPSPNPRVGALIVRQGKIIGQGFHTGPGTPHAEIHALRQAGSKAAGATLFVNLEPCHAFGRTPPCTHAILKSGLKKIVFGLRDPSKAGSGQAFLQKKGLQVQALELPECRLLNQIWLKNLQTKLPFVTLKLALDATGNSYPPKNQKWLTGPAARRQVSHLRREHDAIAVGVKTILADDPRLTVRNLKIPRQPVRLILDPNCRTPRFAKIWQQPGTTILITRKPHVIPGAANLVVPNFNLKKILTQLYQQGLHSILLEGGEFTAGKFLTQHLVDKVAIFQNQAKTPPLICGQQIFRDNYTQQDYGPDRLFQKNLQLW